MARNHAHAETNGHDKHAKHSETNGTPGANGQAKTPSGYGFVTRVTSYPIVQDGVSTVKGYASRSKVASFAIDKASTTLSTVSSYQPRYVQSYYETYVQPHVQRADTLGCKSLDLIQSRFPVVQQPTADIVSAVKAPPRQIITGVRQRLLTTPARAANDRLGLVVDSMEHTIDRYLPPTKTKKQPADKTSANHAVRVYNLLNEASLRVGQLVVEKTPRSRDDIAHLAIVQHAFAQLTFVQETLRHSITVYSQAAQQRLPAALTTRLHQLHGTLTSQLDQLVGFVKTRAELPDWLKSRLQTLADTANAQFEFAKREYARADVAPYDKAKHVAQNLQAQLLPLLQNVQSQVHVYTESVRDKAQKDLGAYLRLGKADAVQQ